MYIFYSVNELHFIFPNTLTKLSTSYFENHKLKIVFIIAILIKLFKFDR